MYKMSEQIQVKSGKDEVQYNDPICNKCGNYYSLNKPLFISLLNRYNFINIPPNISLCDEHLEQFFIQGDLQYKKTILKQISDMTSSSSTISHNQQNIYQPHNFTINNIFEPRLNFKILDSSMIN